MTNHPHELWQKQKFGVYHTSNGRRLPTHHAALATPGDGEEAAFVAHSRMFSHHARPAMVSETRGQNASLHLNGDFGPQRVAILPERM